MELSVSFPKRPRCLRRSGAALGLLVISLFASGPAQGGENWVRFRGPNGAGVAAEMFPSEWTADDYLWSTPLPGGGHSSPVGWDDLVFVTSSDAASGDVALTAIGADDGEIRWTKSFKGSTHSLHAANDYASGTPTVDAKQVFLTWISDGTLRAAAVDHGGEIAWERELGGADYKHGYGNSPILIDETLVVANDHAGDGFVAGLDARTGEVRWRQSRRSGTESYATPLEIVDDAGRPLVVVCSSAEGIAALSPTDGAVLWQKEGIYPARCVNSPIAAGGLVFSGSGEGGNGKSLTAVRPPRHPGDQPAIEFELRKSLGQVPTPIVVGERLYVWNDRGIVTCYDAADGREIWTKRIGKNYFGSPVAAGGKLYCIAADGEAVCIAASDRYELLGRSQLGEGAHATPAIHQGKMYLRTESTLACLPAVE
jgi:outer membrane protein assembly factor BamB